MRLIFRTLVFPNIVCHSLPFSLSVPNYNRLKITTFFSLLYLRRWSTLKEQERVFPKYCLDLGQHLYLFIFKLLPVVNHTVVPLIFEEQKYLERALNVSKGQHTTRRRHSWRPESKGDQGWPPAPPSDCFRKANLLLQACFLFLPDGHLVFKSLVVYAVTSGLCGEARSLRKGGRDFTRVKSNEKTEPKLVQN